MFKNNDVVLDLFVLPRDSAPIIGRDWLSKLQIIKINEDAKEFYINNINHSDVLSKLRKKYKNVFLENVGKCTSHKCL